MNSNRKKYASTPTYGMQKRNFAKKQASAQPTPTPDFTQHSADAGVPVTPFPLQNPFMPDPYAGAPAQPSAPAYYPNPSAVPQGMAPGAGANPFMSAPVASGYGAYPPQNVGTPNFGQPLGNSVPPMQQNGYSPRAQGFVPPAFGQGEAPGAAPAMAMNAGAPVGYGAVSNPGAQPAASPYNVFPSGGMPNSMPGGMQNTMPGGMPGGMQNTMPSGIQNGMPNGMQNGMQNTIPGGIQNGMHNGAPGGMQNGAPGGVQGGMPGGASPYGNAPYGGNAAGVPGMMNASGGGFSGPSQPYPGLGGAARPTPKPPTDMDKVLKILLYGVLPVLFVPCVFVTHTFDFLRYLFIILTVITLSVLWYRQSFSSGLRTTLSVVYLALSIVVISLLVGSGDRDVTQTAASVNAAGSAQATAAAQSTTAVTPEAQATPAPTEDTSASEAEARLSTFMDYWSVNNIEEMVNFVSPGWTAEQDAPAQALFMLISNRTPLNYTIESISGTTGDSSRTVTMSADIDKNNGKDPTRYRFTILMISSDNEWYVDPNSLATNDEEEATATPAPGQTTISQSLAPRMTVTPIPAADTKLYYNENGGKYYHLDPNCSSINSKYLPLTSYFLYSQLDDEPYSSLTPCLKCGAPTQSLGDLAAEETTTPTP